MKKYIIETTDTSEQDLINIISYLRYNLKDDVVANKYIELFTKALKELEYIAGSMPILDEKKVKLKNIRKINVKNYIVFYTINEKTSRVKILRVGHTFMDWGKYLKDK